ncbi:MAG: DUF6458 family protein [Microbacteriaceae bacterium]
MSIGTGIVLLVIGAILTFATSFDLPGVDLVLIGQILMAAGAIVFVIGLVLATRKRQSVTTVRSGVDSASGERIDQRSTSTSNDEPIA